MAQQFCPDPPPNSGAAENVPSSAKASQTWPSNPAQDKEPPNPFYWLLLASGLVLTINAVALAFLPILEERAANSGRPFPKSPMREALYTDGHYWLLYEVAALILFGFLSMALDRLRRLQSEKSSGTIQANDQQQTE